LDHDIHPRTVAQVVIDSISQIHHVLYEQMFSFLAGLIQFQNGLIAFELEFIY
jgi:hypothetical protein